MLKVKYDLNPVQTAKTKEGNFVIIIEGFGNQYRAVNERTIGCIHEKLESRRVCLKLSNGERVNVNIDKLRVLEGDVKKRAVEHYNKRKHSYAILKPAQDLNRKVFKLNNSNNQIKLKKWEV